MSPFFASNYLTFVVKIISALLSTKPLAFVHDLQQITFCVLQFREHKLYEFFFVGFLGYFVKSIIRLSVLVNL